jgi:hypothetical protein
MDRHEIDAVRLPYRSGVDTVHAVPVEVVIAAGTGLATAAYAAFSAYRASKLSDEFELEFADPETDSLLSALARSVRASKDTLSASDVVAMIDEAARKQSDTHKILAKYSAQGLAQSRVSFYTSIVFASLGFLVLLGGVAYGLSNGEKNFVWLPIVSGAVVEAVAGLFFTTSASTQRVMVEFFDKLRSDKRVEDAMTIAEQLEDRTQSGRLRVLLALQFAEVSEIGTLFTQVADGAPVAPDESKTDGA